MNTNKDTKILVVDDCEDNLLLMQLLLKSEGYQVKSANSGLQGLAAIKKQRPDLIVLDLMMPDISGLEVVRRLKNQCQMSSIPIILLTANSNLEYAAAKGVDELCYKPLNIKSILEKIESLLTLYIRA